MRSGQDNTTPGSGDGIRDPPAVDTAHGPVTSAPLTGYELPGIARFPWWRRVPQALGECWGRFERAVSPRGRLRRWLLLCVGAALVLGVPALLLLPLLLLLLTKVADCVQMLGRVLQGLLTALQTAIAIAVTVVVARLLVKAVRWSRDRNPPHPP